MGLAQAATVEMKHYGTLHVSHAMFQSGGFQPLQDLAPSESDWDDTALLSAHTRHHAACLSAI